MTTIRVTLILSLYCDWRWDKHVTCTIWSGLHCPVMFGKSSDVKRKLRNSRVFRDRGRFLFHFSVQKNTGENFPVYLCLIFIPSWLGSNEFMWATSLEKWAKHRGLCAACSLSVHCGSTIWPVLGFWKNLQEESFAPVGPWAEIKWPNWNWVSCVCKPHS